MKKLFVVFLLPFFFFLGCNLGEGEEVGLVYVEDIVADSEYSTVTQLETVSVSPINSWDEYGYDIAISGDGKFIIVGSPNYATMGAVRVYMNTNNQWSEVKNYQYPIPTAEQVRFGESVSVSETGKNIMVGAPNVTVSYGSVYRIYNNALAFSHVLVDGGAAVNEYWGKTVKATDLEGIGYRSGLFNTVNSGSIGVFNDANSILQWQAGNDITLSSYIGVFDFSQSAETIVIQSTLIPEKLNVLYEEIPGQWAGYDFQILNPEGSVTTGFGHSLEISSDGKRIIASNTSGKAFVFDETTPMPTPTWNIFQTISAPLVNEGFGSAVAMSENKKVIVIGEKGAAIDGVNNAGRIHIYKLNATNSEYLLFKTINNPNPLSGGQFGSKVDICGDGSIVVVSNFTSNTIKGQVYVFEQ